MTRKEPRDLLLAHALGTLNERERAELEADLARDPVLCESLKEVRAVVQFLPDPAAGVEPRPGFDTRLQARLDAMDAESRRPARAGRWLAPVAVLGLAAVVLLAVSLQGLGPSDPEPPAAAMLAELDLLQDLDAVQLVDVVDDLDAIESLDLEEEEG
jgi:anti-sigma-K factor RskA